jgi:hypothetical protein
LGYIMRAVKTGILIASVLLLVIGLKPTSHSQPTTGALNACTQQQQTVTAEASANNCYKTAADSSWLAWFTGDSRSAQFHYLDFLELLTGSADAKQPSSLKPIF